VKSIVKNTKDIRYEIIVVDNASTDNSFQKLKALARKMEHLRVVDNKKNLGFSGGNNVGMKLAKGEFILILNSDTVVQSSALSEMVAWMRKNPKAGAVSCALKNKDGSLQGTGGYFPNLFRVFSWMFFIDDLPLVDSIIKPFHPMHSRSPIYKGEKVYKKAKELDWVTGAFLLVRKKVLDEVGLFDEDYFMYTEDTDLCFRIKRAGWGVWYLPQWGITHLGGASSTKEFPILSEYEGIKLFYKKHMPPWQFPILRVFLKTGAILRIPIFTLLKGKEGLITYAKAFKIA
jgi:GT2 family glycosyltransferase